MPPFVSEQDITSRFPGELDSAQLERLRVLLDDAEAEIHAEFARCGRSFDDEMRLYASWLPHTAKRVVIDMVSAAVGVGDAVGVRTLSSTTGPQNDTITYAATDLASWGGVVLSDLHRRKLGLCSQDAPRGRFPAPKMTWPEVHCGQNNGNYHYP